MMGTIGLPRSYGCHILGAVTHRNDIQKSENVSFGKVSVGLRYTFHFFRALQLSLVVGSY